MRTEKEEEEESGQSKQGESEREKDVTINIPSAKLTLKNCLLTLLNATHRSSCLAFMLSALSNTRLSLSLSHTW